MQPSPSLSAPPGLSTENLLPGAARPGQKKYTMTLHTPRFSALAPLRQHLRARLASWGVAEEYIGNLQLTASEIITNLVKHPAAKPTLVHVHLYIENTRVTLDVADDSTPFACFVAKCNAAPARLAQQDLSEGGYGLACIMRMHQDVRYVSAADSQDGYNHFIVSDSIRLDEPVTVAAETPPPAPVVTRRGRVFLVDDDPVSIDIHRRMLEGAYHIETFMQASDVLAAFADDPPDLIISDLNMPGIDGIALRQQLAALEGGNLIPFIFLSNHTAGAHNSYINKIGIDDYLCKPISQERLLAVTARLLQRSAQFASAVQGRFSHQLTSMLHPALPKAYEGWQIAMRTEVAEAGGGDFILYQKSANQMFAVIADVMGHGKQAKFFAYAYAGYLRSLVQLLGSSCDAALFLEKVSTAVNQDSFLDSTIMTCLAFQLARAGEIHLASAGHPAPFLLSRGITGFVLQGLDVAGPLPGLLGESRYVQRNLRLQAGEKVLLATDGFFDAFADDALESLLQAEAHRPAEELADALWQAHDAARLQSHRPADDATLIILQYGDLP